MFVLFKKNPVPQTDDSRHCIGEVFIVELHEVMKQFINTSCEDQLGPVRTGYILTKRKWLLAD